MPVTGTQCVQGFEGFFIVDIEQYGFAAVGYDVLGYGKAETGYAAGDDGADVGQFHG